MERHKVSIVLPVYNNEKTLEKCLASLENQTYKNKEIIVVDDGSSDGSLKILKRFSEIRVIKLEHSGRSHTRNSGILEAQGHFIFFAEGDAYYSKNYLSECAKEFKDKKIGCVAGRLLVWNKDKFLPRCKELEREYAITTRGPRGGWFFLGSLIKKERFNEDLDFGEDVDLAERIKNRGYTIRWCKKARWFHREPETLREDFKRNVIMGKNISTLFKLKPEIGLVEFLKGLFFPLLTLTLIFGFFNLITRIVFLLLFVIFLIRFMKFSAISIKLGYRLKNILFMPVIWVLRSYARLIGLAIYIFNH